MPTPLKSGQVTSNGVVAGQVLTADGSGGAQWDAGGGGAVDASAVTYTPAVNADWDGGVDPGNADDAFDQLAERVTDIETAGAPVDASVVTYTPAVNADWDGGVDPGNADDAFDQLAERVTDVEGSMVTTTVATDPIWDATGDLAVGSGANTATKLASGADNYVLTATGAGAAIGWEVPHMMLLSSTVLGAAAASIDITGISSSFSHLKLVFQGRGSSAGLKSVLCRFNNDSGNNYYTQANAGYATTEEASEALGVSYMYIGVIPGSDATAGFASSLEAIVTNYAGTTFIKNMLSSRCDVRSTASGDTRIAVYACWWNSTAAINRITIFPTSDNFVIGTIFSIYGLL